MNIITFAHGYAARAFAARAEADKAGRDPVTLSERLVDMRERAETAEAQNAKLKAALRDAACWFEEYAYLHKQKSTPGGDAKSAINQARARLLRAVLAEREENGE